MLGRGGIAAVARASGISENTIRKGIREIDAGERLEDGRVRRRGGGRKSIAESDPGVVAALERLVAEDCRGDPMQVLLWTSKSVRRLAAELREQGHDVHFTTVAQLLRSLGYSLQSNRKTLEGAQHPDRDLQFRLINERVGAAIAAGEPAISIDTKKKELVGEFKNAGVSGGRAVTRSRSRPTTSPARRSARRSPTASMTSRPTRGSSTSGSPPRRRSSRSRRSARGGRTWAPSATAPPAHCRSPPTAAAGTATASACGRPSCNASLMRPAFRSASVTSRPAPRNGTRSSTGCSATSARTGAGGR